MSEEQTHEPFAQLVALADEQLQGSERAAVERHVASCQRCAADLAWLRRIGDLMKVGIAEVPPQSASARVMALFRAWRLPPTRKATAAVRFDSATSLRPMGLRSAAATERQLIYSAEPFDVDLRVTPFDTRFTIAGQVLGPETAGFVEVVGADEVQRVPLSEQCEFTLPPLEAGTYELSLRLGDVEVELGELMLSI